MQGFVEHAWAPKAHACQWSLSCCSLTTLCPGVWAAHHMLYLMFCTPLLFGHGIIASSLNSLILQTFGYFVGKCYGKTYETYQQTDMAHLLHICVGLARTALSLQPVGVWCIPNPRIIITGWNIIENNYCHDFTAITNFLLEWQCVKCKCCD